MCVHSAQGGQKLENLTMLALMDAMEDLVRVVSKSGQILFENRAMREFLTSHAKTSQEIFPLSTAVGPFMEEGASVTELCVSYHVYSVKSSPIFEGQKVAAVIQVFRDTTLQNKMTLQILEANRKMHKDIDLATTIQKKMLPDRKSFGPLRFSHCYLPSEELSGDFFDLIVLDDHRIGFYISDVVGHGVSASILTMFVRQSMRSILGEQKISRPREVLQALRDHFMEIHMDDDQYLSLFYALFDTQKDTMTYANAGHNCPPLLAYQGKIERIAISGRLISPVFRKDAYREESRPLRPGERMLFYTDGAVERTNAQGKPYGQENLERILLSSADDILEAIRQDLLRYAKTAPKDDIALFYMENQRR